MKKPTLKIRSIGVIALCWFFAMTYGQSIVVHPSEIKQYVDMIGGDMERSSKAIQNAQNKQEILEWSFQDIKFNVCRVQYDKNQELVEGTKNWDFYAKQVATMQNIKAINPDIKFFATLRSDYDGYGNDNNLPDWIINYNTKVMQREKYGVFLADYLEYMHNQGVTISILSTAKEWMWFVRADKARDVINTMNSELDARGVPRPIIIDQGFWSISAGLTYLKDVASLGTEDLYQGFCSHNYGNEAPSRWVEIVDKSKALGKPMYDDETSTGSGSPTSGEERAIAKQIGEYIKKAERYEAGISGEVFFEIWSRGIDKETRSIYFPNNGTGTRKRGYFLMKQFTNTVLYSNYITTKVNDLSNVYSISFRKGDQIILWIINKSTTTYPLVPFMLEGEEFADTVHIHRWTDAIPIEGTSISVVSNPEVFEFGIPGESITCYTFDLKDYTKAEILNGAATQSSTDGSAEANLAIDGNVDGTFANGSVTLTQVEENPWWQFDLGANDTIGAIQLFKRTDECCKDELVNFTVFVLNEDNDTVFTETYASMPEDSLLTICGGAVGRYVKVQVAGTTALSLSEVKVFKGKVIEKQDQTITFPELGTVSYSSNPVIPGATSSSGLGVSYTSSNADVARIEDGQIVLYGVGTTSITASRPASTSFNAAEDVSRVLTVDKGEQTIDFEPLPTNVKVGDPSVALNATASSGLTVAFSSSDESVAQVEEGRLIILSNGLAIITASVGGNDLFNPTQTTQVFLVKEAENNTDTTRYVLTPTDDAYVRGGSDAGTNFGTETDLMIKQTSNADFYRKTLLQFDVYDVDRAESATLRLYANSAKASNINLYRTSDSWDESTVTYNSAPPKGSSLGYQPVNSAGLYYEWDVTGYVQEQMEGDDVVSFVLEDLSSNKNNINFNSKEADSNIPELVIVRYTTGTSLNQLQENGLTVQVYPNPANQCLFVKSRYNIANLMLVNLTGEVVFKQNTAGENNYQLPLSDVASGVYLLHIENLNGDINSLKVQVQ